MQQKNMKIATITIGSLITITFLFLTLFMDRNIRNSIRTITPRVTNTLVKFEKAKLSLFSGNGEIDGLIIGNPDGFGAPDAINVENVKLNIDTTSFFASNVVINHIAVDGAEVTYEVSENGSNLGVIMKNIESLNLERTKEEQTKPSIDESTIGTNKKLYIKNLTIKNGSIKIISKKLGEVATNLLPLPLIECKDIGKEAQEIKNIKNKYVRKKKSDKMRAVSVPEIAEYILRQIKDNVVSTIEASGLLEEKEIELKK